MSAKKLTLDPTRKGLKGKLSLVHFREGEQGSKREGERQGGKEEKKTDSFNPLLSSSCESSYVRNIACFHK
jgi:hypothetical protein